MSDAKTAKAVNIDHIQFSPAAGPCPTAEDIALWNSLTDEEKEAVLHRELDEAEASGLADYTDMKTLLSELKAELESEG